MKFIVAGSPCSGKSTYVRDHIGANDMVYDYDWLQMALSGNDSHKHNQNLKQTILKLRDVLLQAVSTIPVDNFYFVTSTKRKAYLDELQKSLGAEVVFLSVSREESHQRADVDCRPVEWHTYIDEWFDCSDIDPSDYA